MENKNVYVGQTVRWILVWADGVQPSGRVIATPYLGNGQYGATIKWKEWTITMEPGQFEVYN